MFGKRKLRYTEQKPFKIMFIGDSMVGKSGVCKSYMHNKPYLTYQPTISETHEVKVSICNQDFYAIVWDTAGIEEWDKLRRLDYSNTDCFVLCYAINNKTSYGNVEDKWIPEIRNHCPGVPILLVGTKNDIRTSSNAWISTEEGRILKDRIEADGFIECSAKSIASIEGVFMQAVTIAQRHRQIHDACTKQRRCVVL